MRKDRDPTDDAKAGLQLTAAALIDDYPKAVRDGRTEAWHKAVQAVADWYDHIDKHGIDGRRADLALNQSA